MKLKEFEAKELLKKAGLPCSDGILITKLDDVPPFRGEKVFKVQTMAGGRGKAGGIKIVHSSDEAKALGRQFLGSVFLNECIMEVLLEEKVLIKQELYCGMMFDTAKRCPVVIFSEQGGVDIEMLQRNSPEKIIITDINYLQGLRDDTLRGILAKTKLPLTLKNSLLEIFKKLYDCFVRFDCKMIEVNPLVITPDHQLVAVDGVIVLDENADFRREVPFPERTGNRKATAREIAAHNIDKEDYRGVAGKTFIDLDGDIGILTSGGGASITLLDALYKYGGKPANYTEYSGNPPPEKVEKLTRIVLDKENLSGLLVAGVIANFTNIAETMKGIVAVLKDIKPKFPIVIRRAGPADEEARELLLQAREEYGLDIHYFNEMLPLTKAAEMMVQLSEEYKRKNGARQ